MNVMRLAAMPDDFAFRLRVQAGFIEKQTHRNQEYKIMFENTDEETRNQQKRIDAERKRQRDKQNAIFAKQEAEAAEEKRKREALIPSPDERMQSKVRGVAKLAAKFKKVGEPDKAAKIQAFADEMAQALAEYRNITKELTAKRPAPLADATVRAGKQLFKVLSACFDSETEARDWANSHLPLTEARRAQVKEADDFVRLGRRRGLAQTKFEQAYSDAVRLGTGSVDDKALREVEILGTEF